MRSSSIKKLANTNIICKRENSIFDKYKDDIDILKKHFILTGVDKASNNTSFICKQFYINTIQEELNATNTYSLVTDSEDYVIKFKQHIRFCSKYNIEVKDKTLPFIHMIPKFHKETLDYTYIAAAKTSSTKVISEVFSSILKLVDDRTLNYSDRFEFNFKNTSGYWIVKNKDGAISSLDYLNHAQHASSISSFDFKKLYTNLPYTQVTDKISELIKRCYDEKKLEYINVSDNYIARWSIKIKRKWSFKIDDVIDIFKFIMGNIFIKFQGKIYRQIVGIPMGNNCAPQIADMFLYWYEHKYVSEGVANNRDVVHILKFASRYIDDLHIPNCTNKLENIICNDIFPQELDIVKTNSNSQCYTFLDLDIFVANKQFNTKLYDKRRDFKFNVVTFPHLKSNIPNNPTYGTFIGELHRLCRSCSSLNYFIPEVKLLINKLVNQKFSRELLHRKLLKFLKEEPACLNKYWIKLHINMFI